MPRIFEVEARSTIKVIVNDEAALLTYEDADGVRVSRGELSDLITDLVIGYVCYNRTPPDLDGFADMPRNAVEVREVEFETDEPYEFS